MRILYLNLDRGIPVLGDKGASVHVRAFVRAAAALGHEVALVCPTLGEGNPAPPARLVHLPMAPGAAGARGGEGGMAEAEQARVLRREQARISYDRAAPDRIFAALAAIGFRPDVVYERHALFHSSGVELAARYGAPRLLEVNAPLIEEQRTYRGLLLEGPARAAELASYRGAAAIIAVSEAVADHVADVLGERARVHVAPNGVDLERFAVGASGGGAVRAQLGLGADPVIGFIGSFKPWHGMAFLLEVFAALARDWPGLRLLAVGEGPEREAVAARARALGLDERVLLPGRVPHEAAPAWLEAMDLTAAPYLPREDFYFSPLKIVESLAAGRAVVAPRLGQIESLVSEGVNGRLYAAGDAEDCARAIGGMLADRPALAAMGARGRRSVQAMGWTAVVERILGLAARARPQEAAA